MNYFSGYSKKERNTVIDAQQAEYLDRKTEAIAGLNLL